MLVDRRSARIADGRNIPSFSAGFSHHQMKERRNGRHHGMVVRRPEAAVQGRHAKSLCGEPIGRRDWLSRMRKAVRDTGRDGPGAARRLKAEVWIRPGVESMTTWRLVAYNRAPYLACTSGLGKSNPSTSFDATQRIRGYREMSAEDGEVKRNPVGPCPVLVSNPRSQAPPRCSPFHGGGGPSIDRPVHTLLSHPHSISGKSSPSFQR